MEETAFPEEGGNGERLVANREVGYNKIEWVYIDRKERPYG